MSGLSKNEKIAQKAVGTAPKYKFKMVQSFTLALEIDLIYKVNACDIEDAIKLTANMSRESFTDLTHKHLDNICQYSYNDTEENLRNLIINKAIAKALASKSPKDILCIGQSKVIEDAD